MLARDIEHLIELLDQVIEKNKNKKSPLGYFPALYRKVTIQVRDKINEGYFDDGPRMEKLDVVFANRYLAAYDSFRRGEELTTSWKLAFDASEENTPIVLQHLLLGMNAHINLDLGIAASEVCPGDKISDIKGDFNRINEILASLVDEVQTELAKIWPMLKVIDFIAGRLDESLSDFSMDIARSGAWKVAKGLAGLENAEERSKYIHTLDEKVHRFGAGIYKPGFLLSLLIRVIRLTEKGSVKGRIEILE